MVFILFSLYALLAKKDLSAFGDKAVFHCNAFLECVKKSVLFFFRTFAVCLTNN